MHCIESHYITLHYITLHTYIHTYILYIYIYTWEFAQHIRKKYMETSANFTRNYVICWEQSSLPNPMAGSMLVAVEGMVSWVAIQCLTTKMKCQNQQFHGDRMGLWGNTLFMDWFVICWRNTYSMQETNVVLPEILGSWWCNFVLDPRLGLVDGHLKGI